MPTDLSLLLSNRLIRPIQELKEFGFDLVGPTSVYRKTYLVRLTDAMGSNVCKEEIFRQVFDQWSSSVRSFIAYRAKDVHLAEDIVQEAFHKLWINCKKVSPDKAKSYLFKVAQNTFLTQVKRKGYERQFLSLQKEGIGKDPHFDLEMREFENRLQNAIESLPDDVRSIYLLNRLDQLKYREIAEMLDISIKTVEKKMHQALVELRKIHPNV